MDKHVLTLLTDCYRLPQPGYHFTRNRSTLLDEIHESFATSVDFSTFLPLRNPVVPDESTEVYETIQKPRPYYPVER